LKESLETMKKKIWNIWKKRKLNSEKIGKIWKKIVKRYEKYGRKES
jgi:chaperonin cofactor prefoldin